MPYVDSSWTTSVAPRVSEILIAKTSFPYKNVDIFKFSRHVADALFLRRIPSALADIP